MNKDIAPTQEWMDLAVARFEKAHGAPFNKVAADLIKTSMELIEQVLLKHSNAVLEEMRDQIVKRNTRISELERELAKLKEKT